MFAEIAGIAGNGSGPIRNRERCLAPVHPLGQEILREERKTDERSSELLDKVDITRSCRTRLPSD